MESKYKNLFEWREADPKAVSAAIRKGFIDEICDMFGWENIKKTHLPKRYWTKYLCLEEALKFEYQSDWRKYSNPSFMASRWNGWYKECTAHMKKIRKPKGYWTKDLCFKEALKHDNRKDWKKNNSFSVRMAVSNGWYKECITHMKKNEK